MNFFDIAILLFTLELIFNKYISEKEERSKRFKLAGPQTLMLKKNNELLNEKNK